MANIGDLLVKVKADTSQMTSALAHAENSAVKFSNATKAAIAGITFLAVIASTKALIDVLGDAANSMDQLKDRALHLGAGVEELGKLEFFGSQNGLAAEQLNNLLIKMQVNIGRNKSVFSELGLSIDSLKIMNTTEQLKTIATAVQGLGNESDKAAARFEIFGRQGAQGAELLGANLDGLDAKYQALGLGISQSQADAADAFNDMKGQANDAWNSFSNQLAGNVLPAMTEFGTSILDTIEDMGGVKVIAKDVGETIAEAFRLAIPWIKQAMTELNRFAGILQDMKGRFALVGRAIVGGSVDPSIVGTKDTGSMITAPVTEAITQLRSFIPPIKLAGQEVNTLAKKAKEAGDSLSNMIQGAGSSELGRILGLDNASPEPQLRTERFDESVRKIWAATQKFDLEGNQAARNAQGSLITGQLEQLERYTQGKGTLDFNSEGKSTTSMTSALAELRKTVDKKLGNKQEVTVRVEYDKSGVLKGIVESKAAKDSMGQVLRDLTAKEAQMYGDR